MEKKPSESEGPSEIEEQRFFFFLFIYISFKCVVETFISQVTEPAYPAEFTLTVLDPIYDLDKNESVKVKVPFSRRNLVYLGIVVNFLILIVFYE
jgi:hypothetical protein